MKYKGKEVKGRNSEIIPIKRPDGDIIFIAEAVPDWSDFDRLAVEPEPPKKLKPGGLKVANENDPKYLEQLTEYNALRTHWLILTSLENSPDLEWETVDMLKPETWPNYEKELREADFTPLEVGRIVRGVMIANSLDEDMIDQAKTDFLAGREAVGK